MPFRVDRTGGCTRVGQRDAWRDDDPRSHQRRIALPNRTRQQQRERGEQGEAQQQQPWPLEAQPTLRPHALADPAQRGKIGRRQFEPTHEMDQQRQGERSQRSEAERSEQSDTHATLLASRTCVEPDANSARSGSSSGRSSTYST